MNQPSEEQQIIINYVKNGYNVIVQAVAGSGKSTTVLSIAQQIPDKKILQLTYNSSLRHEIQDKVKSLKLSNISIHTFHSLAVKYYSHQAHNDTGIRKILENFTRSYHEIEPVDILVIDENQDCTELYFRFVVYFLVCMNSKIQLVCLGDVRQCIYQFKGADPRFLIMAREIWGEFYLLKTNIFYDCELKTSYRITNQIGSFINDVMIGEKLMHTVKDGDNVRYFKHNSMNVENFILGQIKKIIDKGGSPGDIFILGASVKSYSIKRLENRLVMNGRSCFVPNFESENLDNCVIQGKIVFSTFHSVKGRQRPYVFILGFDNTYFKYFAKDMPIDECPNTLYVGASRPEKALYITEYNQKVEDGPLEFLKLSPYKIRESNYCDVTGDPSTVVYKYPNTEVEQNEIKQYNETPTKMIKFIPEHILDNITTTVESLYKLCSEEELTNIELPSVHQTLSGNYEDVSDLNGIAIPSFFCQKKNNKNPLKSQIMNLKNELKGTDIAFFSEKINNIPETCDKIDDFLFLANIYSAIQDKLYFRLNQISEYNWIDQNILQKSLNRLENILKVEEEEDLLFEHEFINKSQEETQTKYIDPILKPIFPDKIFRFTAILDIVTSKYICEIKCTQTINIEHKIQLIIYAWLYKALELPEREFKLINLRSGYVYILNTSNMNELTFVVSSILRGKHEKMSNITHEEFVHKCNEIRDEISVQSIMKNFLE